MPITLTAIGTTLQVSVIDEDLKLVQNLLRSGLVSADLVGFFGRYHILRYTGGRLVSSNFLTNLPLEPEHYNNGTFDAVYRYKSDGASPYTEALAKSDYSNYAMELLGKPGPSFYYDFQEDEIDESTLVGIAGWPPTRWPYTIHPRDLCFSPWLTVPGASKKVWVDAPCVARITATALGSTTFSQVGQDSARRAGAVSTFDYTNIDDVLHGRDQFPIRMALIADTNPKLYSDEFVNTNSNIKDPKTGVTATRCTWKVVKEKTFYSGQRQSYKMCAEIALKGRRYYNFSLKMRDGGIRGCVLDLLGVPTFYGLTWPCNSSFGRDGVLDATWLADYTATYAAPSALFGWFPLLNFVNLWENTNISVEFFYNRSSAYRTTSTDADFLTKKP